MTTFPGSPRLIKGGIVLMDPDIGVVQRIIPLQYNPDTITRTLQPQVSGGESGDRIETLRLKGPPIETIKLDAEIDATDQLEFPDQNSATAENGIYPQLAALETIVYPANAQIQASNTLALAGILEVAPVEAPLTLLIWSNNRLLPVRITEFSITEEAFDAALNPIRAKVSLGMRVLSTNDLQFTHKGSSFFMVHHQQKERLAGMNLDGTTSILGIGGIL
jgi:hypothetical protein